MNHFYRYKQNRVTQGFAAEKIAELHLRRTRGWNLVARRFWAPRSEIDLVMTHGHKIYFIEVRSTYSGASEPVLSVGPKKIQALKQASLVFLQRHNRYQDFWPRLDLVVVKNNDVIEHIENIQFD